MRKFEVCIRGKNFLVKTGNKVKKNGFTATRFVEADDTSAAVDIAMDTLRAELKSAVLNDKSDPPVVDIAEVSEVYYFKDELGGSIVWDEKVDEEDLARPVNTLKKKWLAIQNRLGEKDFHIHSIFIHFTSALYPVAIFFMFLFLLFEKTSFRQTYFYIMVLATLSVPFSYLTGILEWKQKYEGSELPIFTAKIRYGLVMLAIGGCCTIWHLVNPEVLEGGNILSVVYVFLNLSILPPLVYLGYLGGIILYERLV